MLSDFCDVCGNFSDVIRKNRRYICADCSGIESVSEEQIKLEIIKQEKIRTREKTGAFQSFEYTTYPSKFPLVYRYKKDIPKITYIERMRSFIKENPDKIFTIKDFVTQLQMPKRNVEHCIYLIRKESLIYSRSIFDYVSNKRYSIYSCNFALVKQWLSCELQVMILDFFIKTNKPLLTKDISNHFNISTSSVLISIRKYLKDRIKLYKLDVENVYVLKDSEIKVRDYFPTAIRGTDNEN